MIPPVLFHVSEESGIRRFEPRPTERFPFPVVWAIDAAHRRNYLLPRDCPRVTYYRTPTSTSADVARFLADETAVVAIERRWLQRVRATSLYCYRMPSDTFLCLDPGAGYFVSREAVVPIGVETVGDALRAIADSGAHLRVLEDLWPLHDAVARSSLEFSMIRMRNAKPRIGFDEPPHNAIREFPRKRVDEDDAT